MGCCWLNREDGFFYSAISMSPEQARQISSRGSETASRVDVGAEVFPFVKWAARMLGRTPKGYGNKDFKENERRRHQAFSSCGALSMTQIADAWHLP